MWVRTRNLTFYYDACKIFSEHISCKNTLHSGHNDPKYLGSAGFLPALQTYICRWNNTCHNRSKPTDEFRNPTSFVYLSFEILNFLLFFFRKILEGFV